MTFPDKSLHNIYINNKINYLSLIADDYQIGSGKKHILKSSQIKQKFSLPQKSNLPIECELINLAIADESDDMINYNLKNCDDKCDYSKYHTKFVYARPDVTPNKVTHKEKPFKFQNSLSTYLYGLHIKKKLRLVGSFYSSSDKIIVCNEDSTTKNIKYRDNYVCVPINSYVGTYNVYFINWMHHWNQLTKNNDTERKWEGAALLILNDKSFDDLDKLYWHKDIVYAHSSFIVSSYDQYMNKLSLDPKMIKKIDSSKKWIDNDNYDSYINNTIAASNFKLKYVLLPNGVGFQAREGRPRPYLYGTDESGTAVAIFLHSLF